MLSNTFTELLLPALMRNNSDVFKEYLKAFEIPLKGYEKQCNYFPDKLLPDQTLWFDFLFRALGSDKLNWKEHSITKKRAILKSIFSIYTEKGTAIGYDTILRLMCDKSLISIKIPPAKAFAGRSTTAEEKEYCESKFPELRIYHFYERNKRHSLFCSKYLAKYPRGCAYETDAKQRVGKQITLYDPLFQSETTLTQYPTQDRYNVGLKSHKSGMFCGAILRGELINRHSEERLYVIALPRGYRTEIERRTYAYPSLTPLTLYYKENRLQGKIKGTILNSAKFNATYLVRQNAELRIFKSIRLFDKDRAINKRWKGSQFLGSMKLGNLDKFHIELYPDMTEKGSKKATYLTKFQYFLVPSKAEKQVHNAIWSMNYMRPAGIIAKAFVNNRKIRKTSEIWLCSEKLKCDDFILEV